MSIRATKNLNDILMILAVMSGALVFAAAVFGIFHASWPVRMYFALIAVALDLVFVLELLGRLSGLLQSSFEKKEQILFETALLALASLVPFIFISGPFLLGWMQSDFNAAAVRGYWTSHQAFALLGTFSLFRLLRIFRPFLALRCRFKHKKILMASIAAATCLCLFATILVESMFLPGYRKTLTDTRNELTLNMSKSAPLDFAGVGNISPDILAIAVDGTAVFSRSDTTSLQPGNYEFFSAGPVGIWFSLFPFHKVRAVSEAMLSGFLCMMAAGAAFALLALKKNELMRTLNHSRNKSPADQPVGEEELDGILGKAR